jgi:pyrrolidone-carboxylate peptidase
MECLNSNLVTQSFDAGTYLCNYIYWKSLQFSMKNKTQSIFIHVPNQETISMDDQWIWCQKFIDVVCAHCVPLE